MRVTSVAKPDHVAGLGRLCQRLRKHVEAFAEARHPQAQPAANHRARERVSDLLSSWGYWISEQGEHQNIVALPGFDYEGRLPAVAAHYDSVAQTPGADDNASALAVMLEVARFAAEFEQPVAALGFNAEELGLLGSREFVAEHRNLPRFELGPVHVLEMVGYTGEEQRLPPGADKLGLPQPERGDFILLAANFRSGELLDEVLDAARSSSVAPPVLGLQLPPGGEKLLPDIERSDHAPFWAAGLPALMWTDTAELRNPNYHGPGDTPETLDYVFMARVTTLLLASLGIDVNAAMASLASTHGG